MSYDGKIYSGDGHIDLPWLPADLFVANAPAHLKDQMPRVQETKDGKQWFAEGRPTGMWVAGAGLGLRDGSLFDPYVPGHSSRLDKMETHRFFSDGHQGRFHPTTLSLRVADQDLDTISGEVIYGILGVAGDEPATGEKTSDESGSFLPGIADPEVVTAVYDIYNEWAAGFCKSHPERLVALGSLSAHDPAVAARQLRGAAEMGLRGAEINVSSMAKPIYHRDWDVLWATSAETNLPVSFHTVGLPIRPPAKADMDTYRQVYFGVVTNLFQLSGAEFLVSIIHSGACTRYPDFKFVLGECGIGWIPYVLQRMDDQYEKQFSVLELGLKPSELWHRQGFSTFQQEFVTEEMVDLIGVGNIMWGSDYPHPDCVFPDSRQVISENLGHLDEAVIHKIVYENTTKLYRLGQ